MTPCWLRLSLALLLTLLLLAVPSAEAVRVTQLECPLPGGASSASQSTCARYSACLWTGSACRLTDRVGYRVQKTERARGPSQHLRLTKLTDATMFGGDVQQLDLAVTKYDQQRMRLTVSRPYVTDV